MHPTYIQKTKTIFLLIIILAATIIGTIPSIAEAPPIEPTPVTTDLHLLRVEHYLYLRATATTTKTTLLFSFPPDYTHQAPLFLEFFNDTSTKLLHYYLQPDTLEPNILLNCTLAPLDKNETILLHFNCWVLIKSHNYEDLPLYVKIPQKPTELPQCTQKWLQPTKVIQVNNILIQHKARQIQRLTTNILTLADRIAWFIKNHRYSLFVLQLNLDIFFNQDAVTTLLINGDNVGRSHLACALFRANTIPARVILALGDQPFWTQMHYIMEYYVPGYGWVIIDTTRAHNLHQPYRQIILRICHPEDEQDTKTDYIFPLMKSEERWLWLNTTYIEPYYVDCDTGSKSRMFSESITTTDPFTADYAHFLTRFAFHYYETYLGTNLSETNLEHYYNATTLQYNALKTLQNHQNVYEYIILINNAIKEYQKIT
ncbi:MAG: transglutaminase-like domain-containing protein [Candidatus Thermoplasmatota archaeon]|nr:transglutaminase-like domain-containing protein [Candidatus Thermoplasmatota archaeon]MBU1941575.1 transglutaminase-like domain-containing protein [Candidatus Thermoplasmatota archaeon]